VRERAVPELVGRQRVQLLDGWRFAHGCAA
jgi:hypothetical protein